MNAKLPLVIFGISIVAMLVVLTPAVIIYHLFSLFEVVVIGLLMLIALILVFGFYAVIKRLK